LNCTLTPHALTSATSHVSFVSLALADHGLMRRILRIDLNSALIFRWKPVAVFCYPRSMNRTLSSREMDSAMRRRDASFDGIFFLGVKTTGVFCRPSCPAKKPLARNVEYFHTPRQALSAGYRPCRRCRPMNVNGRPPEWVGRLLSRIDASPTARIRDADLRGMRIDPARARRFFLTNFGMTFHAYARSRRMAEALHQIRHGARVTDVALGHGFESESGFREAFDRTFGRGPNGDAACMPTEMIESPLGPLLAGAVDDGVCLLEFTDRRALETQMAALRKRFACAVAPGRHVHLTRLRDELAEYFAGRRREFTLPLRYPGTPFQRRVWDGLLTIPYGQTCSYEALADAIGASGAQRAVGRANGQNPIAIVIPCHRVVNKDGELGGYGGGLWRKQFLLDLERGKRAAELFG